MNLNHIHIHKMITYIFQRTLWKYKTIKDEYNKIIINCFISDNKNHNSFSSYIKNSYNLAYADTYIKQSYNLYQSIKTIIKITESINKTNTKNLFHPILLNKFLYKFQYQKIQNDDKINVKRISKSRINDNSISSIKKTIDLDEGDNIQKGCRDFATGNEMLALLKNFQNKPTSYLYNNYYSNCFCNIYKKKKSPQVSFRVFSPKIQHFFSGDEFYKKPQKEHKMINNNIYINNNNYNSHTNFIISDYCNSKEYEHSNNNEKKVRLEKRYYHFTNYEFHTQNNLFSDKIINRNKGTIPLSQSCEKFIYTKKVFLHN